MKKNKAYIIQDDLGEENIIEFLQNYSYSEDTRHRVNQLLLVDDNEVVRCYHCDHRLSKLYIQRAWGGKSYHKQCECNKLQHAIGWEVGSPSGYVQKFCIGRSMCIQCMELCKENHGNISKYTSPQGKTDKVRCYYCDLLSSEDGEGGMCAECKDIYDNDEQLNNARTNPQNAGNKAPTLPHERLYIALRRRGLHPTIEHEVEYHSGVKHIDIALRRHSIYIEVNGTPHTENQQQQRSDLWRTYYAAVNENILTLNVFNLTMVDDNDFHNTVTDIVNIAIEHKEYLQRKKDECKNCPQKKNINTTKTT